MAKPASTKNLSTPVKNMNSATKEELQARAQLVRIHEANCQIEYPTPEEANFRVAVMKQLGRELGLKELRALAMTGPVGASQPLPSGRKA